MSPAKKRAPPVLTPTELELMTLVWELGGGTVAEVRERLPPDRPLAYTSVATILRILEQKGALRRVEAGRGHRFEPLVSKEEHQALALGQVVSTVFEGDPLQLVRRLVDGGLSDAEVSELRRMLSRRRT